MTTSKTILRKKALEDRIALSDSEFQKRNSSLVQQIREMVISRNFNSIHTFLPISKNNEPDMTSLFEGWWKDERRIMVSKTDFKTKKMTHYWYTSEINLATNSWGIPQPVGAELAGLQDADLVIVPLLVGDKQGNRIGYGGGYYDNLLGDFWGHTVGLSLFPLIDSLTIDPWDVPLNVILIP